MNSVSKDDRAAPPWGAHDEVRERERMKRLKLFTGIDLTPSVRAKCSEVAERLRASRLDARFEAPEKLHITLAFLGWVDPEAVEPVRNALARSAQDTAPFDLTLDKLGAFPHERKPRVIWIGASEHGAAFRDLSRALRAPYEALGFHFEKEIIAHVTLAREKGGDAHLPMLDIKPMKLAVRELTLFESIEAERTTRYEVRARYSLKPRG
jgi:2'-5' RNA ligase